MSCYSLGIGRRLGLCRIWDYTICRGGCFRIYDHLCHQSRRGRCIRLCSRLNYVRRLRNRLQRRCSQVDWRDWRVVACPRRCRLLLIRLQHTTCSSILATTNILYDMLVLTFICCSAMSPAEVRTIDDNASASASRHSVLILERGGKPANSLDQVSCVTKNVLHYFTHT